MINDRVFCSYNGNSFYEFLHHAHYYPSPPSYRFSIEHGMRDNPVFLSRRVTSYGRRELFRVSLMLQHPYGFHVDGSKLIELSHSGQLLEYLDFQHPNCVCLIYRNKTNVLKISLKRCLLGWL